MKETISTGAMWNNAGKSGLALGCVSAAFMFISQAVSGMSSATLALMINFLLWIVKFAGCIWLMRLFMRRLADSYDGVTNASVMKFGMMTAFLSALIFSSVQLANMLFISQDLINAQYDEVMDTYRNMGMLDHNTMSVMENMRNFYPQIAFFTQLIYCFVYGTILSAILSRNIPKNDPFANFKKSEDDQQI